MVTYLSLIYFLLALFNVAFAIPAGSEEDHAIFRKANDGGNSPFSGPNQVHTHRVIPTTGGTITEDCIISLNPIVVNGHNLVQEQRECTDTFTPDGTGNSNTVSGGLNTDSGSTSTDTGALSTDSGSSTTDSGTSTADTSSSTADSGSTTADASSTTTADSSTSTDASSSTTDSASSTTDAAATSTTDSASAASSTDSATTQASPAPGAQPVAGTDLPPSNGSPDGPLSVIGASSTSELPGQAATTASSANDTAASTTSGLPGKKLEVLPIGLGVFAGISVIALIVVGLVTYERTKYRRAFRQRRLAASGAEMGYGGMAQRQ